MGSLEWEVLHQRGESGTCHEHDKWRGRGHSPRAWIHRCHLLTCGCLPQLESPRGAGLASLIQEGRKKKGQGDDSFILPSLIPVVLVCHLVFCLCFSGLTHSPFLYQETSQQYGVPPSRSCWEGSVSALLGYVQNSFFSCNHF